ncbi:MAG TPA: hypothetical protein VIR16_01790 [Candidatus Limnocylindrales bacterium]
MRGFLAFIFLGLVALGAGAIGYNIGVSHEVATTAAANGATVVYDGGWHWSGLFFLPFAFFLVPLFFFSFFGFLAFAFGPRRRFGRGWGDHDHDGGPMGFGPMGGRHWDRRSEWIAEAHRRMHEDDAARGGPSSGPSSSGTPGASGTSASSGGPTAG